MSKLVDVLKLVDKLNADDKKALVQHVKAMLGSGLSPEPSYDKPPSVTATDEEIILQSVVHTLVGLGVDRAGVSQLRGCPQYASFVDKAPSLMQFVRKACPTRNQQRVLLCLGVKLLYKDMTAMGLPVSSRLMLAHIHRLPSVINANFPNYAVSGLLGLFVVPERKSNGGKNQRHSAGKSPGTAGSRRRARQSRVSSGKQH